MWPKASFHTGSMTTGLMAHSRMANARANSLALLHIWTAFVQFDLRVYEQRFRNKHTTQTKIKLNSPKPDTIFSSVFLAH